MRITPQAQSSNESLPSYNAAISGEPLPEYTLTNLNPPAEAHTRVRHAQAANPAPAADYVAAQPHLDFDVEANIAGNDASNVSIADFRNLSCTFLCQLRCPISFARVRSPSIAAVNSCRKFRSCMIWRSAGSLLMTWDALVWTQTVIIKRLVHNRICEPLR